MHIQNSGTRNSALAFLKTPRLLPDKTATSLRFLQLHTGHHQAKPLNFNQREETGKLLVT